MDTKSQIKKGMVVGIILLFVGAGVVPSIVGSIEKINSIGEVDEKSNLSDALKEIPTTVSKDELAFTRSPSDPCSIDAIAVWSHYNTTSVMTI